MLHTHDHGIRPVRSTLFDNSNIVSRVWSVAHVRDFYSIVYCHRLITPSPFRLPPPASQGGHEKDIFHQAEISYTILPIFEEKFTPNFVTADNRFAARVAHVQVFHFHSSYGSLLNFSYIKTCPRVLGMRSQLLLEIVTFIALRDTEKKCALHRFIQRGEFHSTGRSPYGRGG